MIVPQVRFATERYSTSTRSNLRCRKAHLTNYSVNKNSSAYVRNLDGSPAPERKMRTSIRKGSVSSVSTRSGTSGSAASSSTGPNQHSIVPDDTEDAAAIFCRGETEDRAAKQKIADHSLRNRGTSEEITPRPITPTFAREKLRRGKSGLVASGCVVETSLGGPCRYGRDLVGGGA